MDRYQMRMNHRYEFFY